MPLFVAHGGQWREVPRYHAKAATYGDRHHFSNIKQIYINNGGDWRLVWGHIYPWQVMNSASWGQIVGRITNPHRPDMNNDNDWISLWGGSAVYMVDWDGGLRENRNRPITGIRLRVRRVRGREHQIDIHVGSYQHFERRGLNFTYQANISAKHDIINNAVRSQWGATGIHHQHPFHGTLDSPWLDCHVPVGEALTVIIRNHTGQSKHGAIDITGFEIIDVRYG